MAHDTFTQLTKGFKALTMKTKMYKVCMIILSMFHGDNK